MNWKGSRSNSPRWKIPLPLEGLLLEGNAGLDVGHRVHGQLVSVDVERGYIDFSRL
ncbi:MAG: hypothetical protein JW704_11020 [Anaerolineaceae bacterium]|nr:hypothetical protein [Anaerolineaceae bacterium]